MDVPDEVEEQINEIRKMDSKYDKVAQLNVKMFKR